MSIKKVLSILLVAIMVFAITGCGTTTDDKNPSSNDEPGSTTELQGEISYATWGSLDEKNVNVEIIEAFEKKYPKVKINLEYIPDKYVEKIDTMFIGGNAPDVIYGHPHQFAAWAKDGLILDLTERFNEDQQFFMEDKFATNMYDSFKYKGANIATINGHDTFLLYYNKTLFDEAGIGYPDDEWTWDDWLDAAKALTNGEGQYGTAYGDFAAAVLFPIVYSFGGNVFDSMDNPTKAIFDSPETIAALKFVQDNIYLHKVAPTYQDKELTGGAFETGRVAMDIEGSWAPAGRRNITDFEWDMANLPLAGDKQRRTSAFYAGYAVNSATKNPDLAYEFAKFFQEDEGQEILSQLGLITVINKEIASSEENLQGEGLPEHHSLRVSSIDYSTNGYANLTNWEEIMSRGMKPIFDQLLANKITPEECASSIQKVLEEMLPDGQ